MKALMRGKENRILISIVAPILNEAAVIGQFIERIGEVMKNCNKYDYELVLVDDGSIDESLKTIREFASSDSKIRVVELMKNFGQTSALSAGIDESKGEIIITMDSDLQHFPEDIPLFLVKIEEGYDLVCGWRKERKEGIVRRWPSRIANYIAHRISRVNIHDFGTTFRAYKRGIFQNIEMFGEMHRFIPALASRMGCRIVEIPIQNVERPAGKSNYSILRTYGVALDLLFLFFYLNYLTKPIRIFGFLAMLLFAPGFIIALALTVFAYCGIIPGVREHIALLLFSILLMILGVNILCYGLIAEVQNRIYYAVRKEKIYHIRNIWRKEG